VRRLLDARDTPLEFFIRDDDAGWADDRLFALLDGCDARGLPIDLAVIPAAVQTSLAWNLIDRIEAGAPLGLHQHGFSHTNHEAKGRQCEFGSSRPVEAQQRDIEIGRRLLLEHFGPHVDSIFTPPWNRCTSATGACLRACGIAALSRDHTAVRLGIKDLVEIPVTIDWFAQRRGTRLTSGEWACAMALAVQDATGPLGLMLHHAVMNDTELRACEMLLDIVACHPQVRARRMREVAGMPAIGGRT